MGRKGDGADDRVEPFVCRRRRGEEMSHMSIWETVRQFLRPSPPSSAKKESKCCTTSDLQ
jgi:hypothetical protein